MTGMEFRRKLYKRGASYETTVPRPMMFALDDNKKYTVVFAFDPEANKWFLKFEERRDKNTDQVI